MILKSVSIPLLGTLVCLLRQVSRSTRSVPIFHSERLIDAFLAEVSLCEIRFTQQPEEAHICGQTRSFLGLA